MLNNLGASVSGGLWRGAMAVALAAGAGWASAETITYVESEPLHLQESIPLGETVDIALPQGYRLVVNDRPVTVTTNGTVTYKFDQPGDYVVVTERLSGDKWVAVSTAKTTVMSQSTTTPGTTTTTTTKTTTTPGGSTVEKTTTTSQPATTGTKTVMRAPDGNLVTFYEDKPLTVHETYTVGQPLAIQVPETVQTEYRFRINNEPVTYDVKSRQVNYTFSKAGDYEIVTEKRVGTTWEPVYTTKTVVVEK